MEESEGAKLAQKFKRIWELQNLRLIWHADKPKLTKDIEEWFRRNQKVLEAFQRSPEREIVKELGLPWPMK